MKLLLVGAGGHARSVAAAVTSVEHEILAYDDPKGSSWCRAPQVASDDALPAKIEGGVMGVGGVASPDLVRRLDLLDVYTRRGLAFPAIAHARAILADDVEVAEAAVILAGAIVQAGAKLGRGVIVNTGAIIEHDAVVEEGAHIAPSAVVLGGGKVGAASMIGAGAVVLPGASVPGKALIRSLERFGVVGSQ